MKYTEEQVKELTDEKNWLQKDFNEMVRVTLPQHNLIRNYKSNEKLSTTGVWANWFDQFDVSFGQRIEGAFSGIRVEVEPHRRRVRLCLPGGGLNAVEAAMFVDTLQKAAAFTANVQYFFDTQTTKEKLDKLSTFVAVTSEEK